MLTDDMPPARLDLLKFTPFRLNRLAAEFSTMLAEDYASFGIDIPDWRVLSTLGGQDEPCTAGYVVQCTRTHKTRISRAVSHLVELGFIERRPGAGRREIMLRLTPRGRDVYSELVPILLAREQKLLAGLTPAQRNAFATLLTALEGSLGLVR